MRELVASMVESAIMVNTPPIDVFNINSTLLVEEVSRSLTATLVGDAIMGAPFSIDDWVGNELGSFIGHSIGTSIKTQAREYYALKRGRDQLTEQDMHKVGDLSDEQSPHTTKSHDEVSNTLRGSGHDEKAMGAQAPAPYKDHDGSDYQKHITEASTNWLEAGGNTPDILKSPAQLYQEWFMAGLYDAQQSSQPTASRDIMTMGWQSYMHLVANYQSPWVQDASRFGYFMQQVGMGTSDFAVDIFHGLVSLVGLVKSGIESSTYMKAAQYMMDPLSFTITRDRQAIGQFFSCEMTSLRSMSVSSLYADFKNESLRDQVHDILNVASFFAGSAGALKGTVGLAKIARAGEVTEAASVFGAESSASRGGLFGVREGLGLTSRLSRTQIRDYLSKATEIPREQLVKDFESIGFKFKGGSKDGRFMEFIDKNSSTRVKIHPPDNVGTDYHHVHVYDKVGNSLNSQLEVVPYNSPEAHIEIDNDLINQRSISDGRLP